MPSSGEMRSPVPEISSERSLSATISSASSWRRTLSVRQSRASSIAERSRLPRYSSSFASNFVNSANASAEVPGEAGDDGSAVQPPDLRGAGLHDRRAHRDLAVAGDRDFSVAAHAQDRGGAHLARSQAHAETIARESSRRGGFCRGTRSSLPARGRSRPRRRERQCTLVPRHSPLSAPASARCQRRRAIPSRSHAV